MKDKKNPNAYKTIGEITQELDLIDKKTGRLQTHTIRYWESQFKQIKPKIGAGRRRYYSPKDIEIIRNIGPTEMKTKWSTKLSPKHKRAGEFYLNGNLPRSNDIAKLAIRAVPIIV